MSPAPNKKLGRFVRQQREAAGWTQAKLADEAGVQRSQVLRIERGDIRPGPDTLSRLADALRIAVEDLYALAGYTAPHGLPGFSTYLRTKYGMSEAAVAEAEALFEELQHREQGGPDDQRAG
jgi:transcriptional regulator with XRE-family HTH domain